MSKAMRGNIEAREEGREGRGHRTAAAAAAASAVDLLPLYRMRGRNKDKICFYSLSLFFFSLFFRRKGDGVCFPLRYFPSAVSSLCSIFVDLGSTVD